MKIQLMSDLHFEFHSDGGEEFINSLDPSGVDALILAGDIANIDSINKPIELLCNKYKRIIMSLGNHCYYNSDAGSVLFNFEQLSEKYSNFHFLDNSILELEGQRFLGSTLWFPYVPEEYCRDFSDFRYIKNLSSWVFEENKKSVGFFKDNLKENDIVITHHLPSSKCVAEKYKYDSGNCFFVCGMDDLILERNPKLWMFGHTHSHVDMSIGKTRMLANPRGYVMYGETIEGNGFNDKLIIEV